MNSLVPRDDRREDRRSTLLRPRDGLRRAVRWMDAYTLMAFNPAIQFRRTTDRQR